MVGRTLGRCELPGLAVDATMRQRRELGGAQVTQTATDVGQSANPIQPLRLGTAPSRGLDGREEMCWEVAKDRCAREMR